MNNHSYSRRWNGINDPVHPLSRTGHSAISHGRYIYILNGYGPSDKMVLFDQIGLTRYDTLTNCVECLPIHWDIKSLQNHMFNEFILLTTGNSAVLCPESSITTTDNDDDGEVTEKQQPACIYTFGGYSLLGNIHVNALCRYELTQTNNTTHCHHSCCCHASVISGHGILSCLAYSSHDISKQQLMNFTMLKSFQRQLQYYQCNDIQLSNNMNLCTTTTSTTTSTSTNCIPSPRDKLCMEYWHGKLYAFGGYGPQFHPSSSSSSTIWPNELFHWPYLYDPQDHNNWIMFDNNGGWNNQLIVYDLVKNQWDLIRRQDVAGRFPTPRAAHCSVLLPKHDWMIIFGGRGPYYNPPNRLEPQQQQHHQHHQSLLSDYRMGRLNDMHCFNLNLNEWTRILTPLDIPQIRNDILQQQQPPLSTIWPCGRSWMDMVVVHESSAIRNNSACYYEHDDDKHEADFNSSNPIELFLVGGFSNNDEALNDAYCIHIHLCQKHKQLEAVIVRSTKQVHIENDTCLTDFNQQHHRQDYCSLIEPMKITTTTTTTTTTPTNSKLPMIIDGYVCLQPPVDYKKYMNLQVNSIGEILPINEQLYIDCITSNYSIDDPSQIIEMLMKSTDSGSSCSSAMSPPPVAAPSSTDTDHLNLFLKDLQYHLYMYQTASFTLHNQSKNNLNPTEPLYRIALLHTIFIQYLLKNYCLYTVSRKNKSKNSKSNNSNNIPKISELLDYINIQCDNYQFDLEPIQNSILSVLIGMYLKLMLPWQIIQMILQEHNSWLTMEDRITLLHKLIPLLNAMPAAAAAVVDKRSTTTHSSKSTSDMHQLDLNDQSIRDKLLLLITPSQIRNPVNYIRNHANHNGGIDHLFQYLQQIIMSTLILYSSQSPLHNDIAENSTATHDNIDGLLSPLTSSPPLIIQPLCESIHRHWHTVTIGLNDYIYVIGGTVDEALALPLECYHLYRPISLMKQCSMQITKMILLKLYTIANNSSTTTSSSISSSSSSDSRRRMTMIPSYSCHSIQNKFKIQYLNKLDKYLQSCLLNNHIKSELEQWLL
ncbi:unnamed protein product [Schistosoma turkestanicum]|nr:unnamed protein product [Schistosoma turkestanicum]